MGILFVDTSVLLYDHIKDTASVNKQNPHKIDLKNMLWLRLGVDMSKEHNALFDSTFIGTRRYSILESLYKNYDIGGIAIIYIFKICRVIVDWQLRLFIRCNLF